jgi:hypothetical protein
MVVNGIEFCPVVVVRVRGAKFWMLLLRTQISKELGIIGTD